MLRGSVISEYSCNAHQSHDHNGNGKNRPSDHITAKTKPRRRQYRLCYRPIHEIMLSGCSLSIRTGCCGAGKTSIYLQCHKTTYSNLKKLLRGISRMRRGIYPSLHSCPRVDDFADSFDTRFFAKGVPTFPLKNGSSSDRKKTS